MCHETGLAASKNGREFADYVRLLSLRGAREQKTMKLRWAEVDFEKKLLTIGADADTKNREARRVDCNAGDVSCDFICLIPAPCNCSAK